MRAFCVALTAVLFLSQGASAGDWPQWRGPNRDDISDEKGLLTSWPSAGPRLDWTSRETGIGYAGVAVVGDVLYTMGAEGTQEFVLAIDNKSGKKLWSTPIGQTLNNGWGDGPRGTPTVVGDRVYTLSGVGNLVCVDAKSGEKVWAKRFTSDFQGKTPNWGYCESPLVDGDKVVGVPGGANCMVALDKNSGATIWTSSGLEDPAHYSSIVIAEVGGVRMYVTMTRQGVIGVSANDGKLLWRFEKTANGTAVIPTPVVKGEFVYSTSGYGTGCGLVRLSASGSGVEAEEVYFNRDMKNHHGGVVLVDGKIYGYSEGPGWLCQDFQTGKVVWNYKNDKSLGKGCLTYADGHLYCFTERDGKVALVKASSDGFKMVSSFVLPEKTKTDRKRGAIWTHPVISGGKLYLRDQEVLFCFDVKNG